MSRGLREVALGIGRHPLRSLLVLFTFSLGFASVVATVATVEGGRRTIQNDLENLGVDVIAAINPLRVGPITIGDGSRGSRLIDGAMVRELEKVGRAALDWLEDNSTDAAYDAIGVPLRTALDRDGLTKTQSSPRPEAASAPSTQAEQGSERTRDS